MFRSIAILCIAIEVAIIICISVGLDVPTALVFVPLVGIVGLLCVLLGTLLFFTVREGWIRSAQLVSERFSLPYKPIAFWVYEISTLVSLIRRRRRSSGEVHIFSYSSSLRPVVFSLAALSVVELVVVHLAITVVWLKWTIFGLSVYAVVALIGFYRANSVNGHCITPCLLEIRNGDRLIVDVSREDVEGFGRCSPGSGGSVSVKEGVARIPVMSQVNVYIETSCPVTVKDLFSADRNARRVEFFVDDPNEFLERLGD